MTAFTITVQDDAVQAALKALVERVNHMAPVLTALGDDITERTKRRFETSSGPDGAAWAPNSAATLGMLAGRLAGQKSKRTKGGDLNAKGRRELAGKKPLIDKGNLWRGIYPEVSGNTLTVGSPERYAAIQQFGGKAGRGHKVTIPARPYLPVRLDGTLYPQEQALVLQALNEFLAEDL